MTHLPQVIRVLIIADDEDSIFILRRLFTEVHRLVVRETCVSTPEEACALLKDSPDVDIVLCDLDLHSRDALSIVRSLQGCAERYPIVLLAESENAEAEIEAIRMFFQDYLIKARLGPDILYRTVRYAIERHHLRASLGVVQEELKKTNLYLKEANARLEIMVERDPLTDLLNRRGLHRVLSREISWSQRDGAGLVVVLADLDDFKTINDSWGHVVGDVVLKEVAARILSASRATDYQARIGGDEFLVLLPETRLAEGLRVAEKVRLAISEPLIVAQNGPVHLTASIGVALITEKMVSIDDLLIQTKVALKRSKQSGKNMVSSELALGRDPDLSNKLLLDVFDCIRSGDAMKVVRQPILALQDETLRGYEFLSRSNIPGFEMPGDFFRICQEHNMLAFIDQRCFQQCMDTALKYDGQHRCHVNIFPSTLMDIPMEKILWQIKRESSRKQYCVEISEQQIIGNPSYLQTPAAALRRAGVKIAIDDVGFGRTSLESLLVLEPDVIKVDMRLVQGVHEDQGKRRSLMRLLRVAKTLGAEIVAEGIETREELAVLRDLGVPYGQGFLWGKPS